MLFDRYQGTLRWERRPEWRLFGHGGSALQWSMLLGVVVLGLLAGAWASSEAWQQHLQTLQAQARLDKLAPPQQRRPLTPPGGPLATERAAPVLRTGLTPDQRQSLRSSLVQIHSPWPQLFEQLERSTPPDVALVSMEVQAARAVLRIQAEARSIDGLLGYAYALQHQAAFGRLTLISHEPNERHAARPHRLTFELSLSPDAFKDVAPSSEARGR